VVEYVSLLCCGGGGDEYRSLISTDGFVNLREGPLRFALEVNQTNSAGTARARARVCVCVCGLVVAGWGGGGQRGVRSVGLPGFVQVKVAIWSQENRSFMRFIRN